MKNLRKNFIEKTSRPIFWGLVIALGLVGYSHWDLGGKYDALRLEKASLETNLMAKEELIVQIEGERMALQNDLLAERQKNQELGTQVSQTNETLEKLKTIDEELLQKYSKVFFLNEHYVPDDLSSISKEYLWDEKKEIQIHPSVESYLKDMLSDAAGDEINMYVVSGYRSFDDQSALKSGYKTYYGSGANRFSADQGYSEHQLGTTVDLTIMGVGASLAGFDKTDAYKWLQNNAYKYGFVLSYPKGNLYYIFEPWHWRFVGRALAGKLHDEEKNFYDLSQQQIDEYLMNIFD